MGGREEYRERVVRLLESFLNSGSDKELRGYLLRNSNLPGPRGNLELAWAFGDAVQQCGEPDRLWDLSLQLSKVPPASGAKDASEFLAFCGVIGLSAVGSSAMAYSTKAMSELHILAGDTRWRVREAVAMGVQRLISVDRSTFKKLEPWVKDEDWMAMRAVAAGVAEPALLKDANAARASLDLHRQIMKKLLPTRERRSEEFRVLRQALGYSLSVVVRATPRDGFAYLKVLIETNDVDVSWIVRENLKKDRLVRNFPSEVARLSKLASRQASSVQR